MHGARAPRKMLVHTSPVPTETKTEQQFLERDAADQYSAQCGKIPYLRDVARRQPHQPQHEDRVQTQEDHTADQALHREIRATEAGGNTANHQAQDGRVNGIPGQEIERHEQHIRRPQGGQVEPMPRSALVPCTDRNEGLTGERAVQGCADPANGKREHEALDIEPRALGEFKEAWRIPVRRHPERFSETKHGCGKADAPHHRPEAGGAQIEREPGHEKGARPAEPHIVIGHAVGVTVAPSRGH